MITIRNTDQIVDVGQCVINLFFKADAFLLKKPHNFMMSILISHINFFFSYFFFTFYSFYIPTPGLSLPFSHPVLPLHHSHPPLRKDYVSPWEVNKSWHIKLRQEQVPTPAEQGLPLFGMCFKKPDHAPGIDPSSSARGPTKQATQLSPTFRRPHAGSPSLSTEFMNSQELGSVVSVGVPIMT